MTIIHPIPKRGKDSRKPENLRPIALTPVICKLTERLINRLQHHLEHTGWFHPALTGFHPNLGTHDYLWLLRRVINRTSRKSLPDYILALDMHKAFDNVSQEGILQELAAAFPSQKAQRWIRGFLAHRPICLNPKQAMPTTYYLDRGVPQGSILGPLLFNLAMNRVARTLEMDSAARFAFYADDTVVWTEAADYDSKESMQAELQADVFSLERTLSQFQLKLSPNKTQFLSDDGKRSTNPDQVLHLNIANTILESRNGTIKLLGLQISSCNSPTTWIRHLRTTWHSTLHLITRLSNKYGGSHQDACLKLARAVAHGRLSYGFPVCEFRPRHLSELTILNRHLIRTITGLPCHTRTDVLEQAVPLPPITNIVEEVKLRFQKHLEYMPQGRAIFKWDTLNSNVDPAVFPKFIPPWERPAIGPIR